MTSINVTWVELAQECSKAKSGNDRNRRLVAK